MMQSSRCFVLLFTTSYGFEVVPRCENHGVEIGGIKCQRLQPVLRPFLEEDAGFERKHEFFGDVGN